MTTMRPDQVRVLEACLNSGSDAQIKCPRCGREQCSVTWTRRGTPRLHSHLRPDGTRCKEQEPT